MPSNPHYEAVRKAVIAACPELMELGFGTKIKIDGFVATIIMKYDRNWIPENTWMGFRVEQGDDHQLFLELDKEPFEVIERPIEIKHILLTVDKVGRFVSASSEGKFAKLDNQCGEICFWDLTKDDLASQSPEIWEALDKMLSV